MIWLALVALGLAQDPQAAPVEAVAPLVPVAPVVPASAGEPPVQEPRDLQGMSDRIGELEARLKAVEHEVGSADVGPGGINHQIERPPAGETPPEEAGVRYSGPLVVVLGQRLEKAVSFGGPIDVQGTVLGDAVSVGSDIVVRSTGVVEGNAVSVGGRVVVEPGGDVQGDRVALGETTALTSVAGAFGDGMPGGVVRGVFRQLSVLSCLMGAGVLLMGLWPQNVERVARPLGDRPFWYGIAGAILTGCFAVGSGLLAITFVGLPIALLLSVILVVAWLLGVVALCRAIGERFPFAESRGAWAAFLAGAVLLGLVSLLPYAGPVIVTLIGFPAVGAALMTRLGNRVAV